MSELSVVIRSYVCSLPKLPLTWLPSLYSESYHDGFEINSLQVPLGFRIGPSLIQGSYLSEMLEYYERLCIFVFHLFASIWVIEVGTKQVFEAKWSLGWVWKSFTLHYRTDGAPYGDRDTWLNTSGPTGGHVTGRERRTRWNSTQMAPAQSGSRARERLHGTWDAFGWKSITPRALWKYAEFAPSTKWPHNAIRAFFGDLRVGRAWRHVRELNGFLHASSYLC